MKSVGKVIKEARIRKRLSRKRLESLTKIKKEFIEAIENESWGKLPEYPVVAGFVKTIAKVLKLNEQSILALLRRDYPPKDLQINPKEEIPEKFTWNPKFAFIVGALTVSLLIIGYLLYQYFNFVNPPKLIVENPVDGQSVSGNSFVVVGRTDPDASILVNNQPTIVEEDGRFSTEIEISEGTTEIVVVAKSRSGKETIVRRKIIPKN